MAGGNEAAQACRQIHQDTEPVGLRGLAVAPCIVGRMLVVGLTQDGGGFADCCLACTQEGGITGISQAPAMDPGRFTCQAHLVGGHTVHIIAHGDAVPVGMDDRIPCERCDRGNHVEQIASVSRLCLGQGVIESLEEMIRARDTGRKPRAFFLPVLFLPPVRLLEPLAQPGILRVHPAMAGIQDVLAGEMGIAVAATGGVRIEGIECVHLGIEDTAGDQDVDLQTPRVRMGRHVVRGTVARFKTGKEQFQKEPQGVIDGGAQRVMPGIESCHVDIAPAERHDAGGILPGLPDRYRRDRTTRRDAVAHQDFRDREAVDQQRAVAGRFAPRRSVGIAGHADKLLRAVDRLTAITGPGDHHDA